MGAEDRIDYSGPDLTYRPGTGGNLPGVRQTFLTPQERSYADSDLLTFHLEELLKEAKELADELENDLLDYVMPIPRGDSRLIDANSLEWPENLGAARDYVSYRFYRALSTRSSTSSAYIRSRFQDAIRDYTGTDGLDLLNLVELIISEAELQQQFLSTYIGDVDDSSEMRIVELFLDWAQGARQRITEIRNLHDQTIDLPTDDSSQMTPREARAAQASFKVKLNAANREVGALNDFLATNYSDHAAAFYGRYLGPALQFRLAVTRRFNGTTGTLGQQTDATNNVVDARLEQALADQVRRNVLFESKAKEVLGRVGEQDTYRSYIQQLAPLGRSVVAGQPGTVALQDEDPAEVDHFTNAPAEVGRPAFKASHSALADLLDPQAHEQYLMRLGDTLTGDLGAAPGVKIDGMDVSEHAHTGKDGSKQIQGDWIAGGTLPPGTVDHSIVPGTPTNLRLIRQNARLVPPGVTVVDVLIAWEGDDHNTYEVQFAPVI